MSLKQLAYPLFFICLLGMPGIVLAQKEVGETIETSKEGKNAITDSFYFEAVKARMKNDEPMAYQLFERFSELRPELADPYYELAKLSYNEKKLGRAEDYIKKAIALNGGNKWYKDAYATILAEKGDYAEAARLMAELIKDDQRNINYILGAAEYYEKAKKYDDAITYLDKATTLRGIDEDIQLLKEHIYLSMNNVEKAAEMVRQLIAQDPKAGRYYKTLGDLYDNNRLSAKAAEVYEGAEKMLPADPYIQAGRAEHFLRIGDTASYVRYMSKAIINKNLETETQVEWLGEFIQTLPSDSVIKVQAIPITRQLVGQHPNEPQLMAYYGDLLESNHQPDSAAWAYSRSLQLKPAAVDVWRRLLDNYWSRQMADSMLKYSEKYMRLYPSQVDPQFYNAQAHFIKKDYDKAIKAINRGIDFEPGTNKQLRSTLYALLAEIYHANKQEEQSEKAYDRAIDTDPTNASALNNFAYNLAVAGKRLDDAEKYSKRSLDLKPGESTFLDTYGWIQYKKGDYEKAKVFVMRAIVLAGGTADGALYAHLGDILYKLNDKAKAVDNWKQAKLKGSDDKLIDKKISEEKLYE